MVAVWAVYGAILGPVALVLLWLAPHGHCQTCHLPTLGWSSTCPWCRSNVNEVPRSALRGARMPPAPQPTATRASSEATARPETPPPARRRTAPRPFVLQSATADGPASPAPGAPHVRSGPPVRHVVAPAAVPDAAHPPAKQPEPPAKQPEPVAKQAAPAAEGPAAVITQPVTTQLAPVATQPATPTNGTRPPDRIVAPAVHRPPARVEPEAGPVTRLLATATYVTGTARLEPGRRYGIAIREARFQVLGPVDIDDKVVALERPVADINVSGLEGRLVVSEQKRSGVVLAFMSVAGAGLDELAGAIRAASEDAQT